MQTGTLSRLASLARRELVPAAVDLVGRLRREADGASLRLLGPDFEERVQQLERRYAERGGDPFGLDAQTAQRAVAVCAFLHRAWFRTEVHGLEHVPEGRVLIIANHSGQVPLDGAIIGAALFLDADPPRIVRAMVEKWAHSLPFVSTFFSRVGQVVGVPENAVRLLEMEEALLVFPEGTRGISKPFHRRYQLEEFGLGFMRLAIATRTPIVPVAVVGAEEQYVNLGNLDSLARWVGMPVFPVVPQWLVPGGQLPLPVKYRLYFGEPMTFEGDPDDDDAAIEEKVWVVRQTIQSMLNRGLATRRGIFT